MFTGIVQGLCRVAAVVDEPGLRRLRIDLGELALGLETGASVAVNGTCLTATQIDAGQTPTFAVFGLAQGSIPFDPANNRVFVRYKDQNGVVRGATSVAVRTP